MLDQGFQKRWGEVRIRIPRPGRLALDGSSHRLWRSSAVARTPGAVKKAGFRKTVETIGPSNGAQPFASVISSPKQLKLPTLETKSTEWTPATSTRPGLKKLPRDFGQDLVSARLRSHQEVL